jgi:FkbH-like protein
VKSALRGILGKSKKLVVLDLDDTLWGGIVGDQGWQNLRLGGHDPIGEACVDFQRELKSMANRGILLAIVSKNEESVALEAIRNHPEMVLRLEDFAGWRINWLDKASNMVDLVSSLNLGLDSVVFIDDNPVERKRVSEAFPQIFVPDWPEDKMLYKAALQSLSCFEGLVVTQEDRSRTRMYAAEKERASSQVSFLSLDEWLEDLGTVVAFESLNQSNLPRANQLLNKTNQMNLSTRRMSEQALLAWATESNRRFWVFRVKDKFGDLGLTGLLSLELDTTKARIADFILSCRVMGRKIEEAMLARAIEAAQSLGSAEVYAQYVATEKNKPCLDFLKRSGFRYCEDGQTFHWDTKLPYPVPKQIHFEFPG